MFDGKFIATLLALVLTVITICKFNTKVSSTEGFGMLPSRVWKKDVIMASSAQAAAKGDFYSVPGTYQAILNPRFSNVQYGSNIRYNMPSHENQAVPFEPLTFGNMAKENYQEKITSGDTTENYGCGKGAPKSYNAAPIMEGDYAAGNYNEVVDNVMHDVTYPSVSSTLPIGDMTTVNALGETVQPIVYERFVYANRNSRLRGLGDPIRGDLPIVPHASDWFRPSVHPTIDLHEGAMNVMGGVDNGTTQALADLINTTSGDSTIAGVNMSSMKNMSTGMAMADVNVTSFP